jgi:hypothetical protein
LPPGIADDRNTADGPSADAGHNAFVEADDGADCAINGSIGRPAGLLIADEPIAMNGAAAALTRFFGKRRPHFGGRRGSRSFSLANPSTTNRRESRHDPPARKTPATARNDRRSPLPDSDSEILTDPPTAQLPDELVQVGRSRAPDQSGISLWTQAAPSRPGPASLSGPRRYT